MNNSDDLDPRLQQLYRQLPKEQPSSELDEKILAAAGVGAKKRLSWYVPFSIAASVVMVSSLVLYLTKQPETLQQAMTPSKSHAKEMVVSAPAPVDDLDTANYKDSAPITKHNKPIAAESRQLADIDELQSLRTEQTQKSTINESKIIKEEVTTSQPPQLAIKKYDHDDELSSIRQSILSEDKASPEQSVVASAPAPASANVGSVALSAKKQLDLVQKAKLAPITAESERVKSVAFTIENIRLGMTITELLQAGFVCKDNVCLQTLSHPKQLNYWGVSSAQAQLKATLSHDKVKQLELIQQQVNINAVLQEIALLGVVTERVCDEQKGAIQQREVNSHLLQIYQQDKTVRLVICSAE